jgi:hypothetical protein
MMLADDKGPSTTIFESVLNKVHTPTVGVGLGCIVVKILLIVEDVVLGTVNWTLAVFVIAGEAVVLCGNVTGEEFAWTVGTGFGCEVSKVLPADEVLLLEFPDTETLNVGEALGGFGEDMLAEIAIVDTNKLGVVPT